MNTFLVCVSRWMLASFWVFGALQQSESEILCDEPENPKIVLFEVNSKKVSLNWKNCRDTAGENIISYAFKRESVDGGAEKLIASRGASEGGFTMEDPFKDRKKYNARLDQELIILNVQRNEEYVYILEIGYQRATGGFPQKSFRVTVEVKVPPKITLPPKREEQVSLNSVKNHTLRCNASGDPHPNITWKKAGIPESQFNGSGYVLHLVDIKREDAGSYICTASNGFGNTTSAIGIVNIKCTSCNTEKVGIRIKGVTFGQPLTDQESEEFKELESSLLSAIWGAYADNPGKQLHRVDVKEFRNGSVYAIVELAFAPSSVRDLLEPLEVEMGDEELGSLTVDTKLDVNPSFRSTITEGTSIDANWRSERQILHAVYSTVICLLVGVVIVLVILLWRGRYNKGGISLSTL